VKTPFSVPVQKKRNADYNYDYGLNDKEGINILHSNRFNYLDLKTFYVEQNPSIPEEA
jgi:hypothetical protein